jgi:hypothetical protein
MADLDPANPADLRREKCREYKRKWYRENKDKARASTRAWRERNRPKLRNTELAYRLSEHGAEIIRRSRARCQGLRLRQQLTDNQKRYYRHTTFLREVARHIERGRDETDIAVRLQIPVSQIREAIEELKILQTQCPSKTITPSPT